MRGLENGVKDGHELQDYFGAAGEKIRALRLQATGGTVLCVEGEDDEKNPTCLLSSAFAVQIICKIVKLKPRTKRIKIGFITDDAPAPTPDLSTPE